MLAVQRGALVGVELVLAAPPVDGVEAMVVAHQVEAAGKRHIIAHLRGLRHHQLHDLHRLVTVRPHPCGSSTPHSSRAETQLCMPALLSHIPPFPEVK